MIIYAKSFSNPSVSISHDATGLSAVCDCGISLSYSLTFFDKKTYLKFFIYVYMKNSPIPMAARFFHPFK